jgi:predicted acyl esterase
MRPPTPIVIACLLAALLGLPSAASAAAPPPGSTWTEEYLYSGDGTKLHADVLRPAGLAPGTRTPVILTVSPYTNHSGQPLTPDLAGGPSSRFYDLLEQGRVFERGYTYVYVDLRGTGGSSGCNDWGGLGEQADVKAAVEWAASRAWSDGRVAMYGKSYDAWTGLMALAQRPRGLAAVVSQEPVVDGYRYLYMNRVRFPNALATPALFQVIDAQPGHPSDSPEYQSANVWANVVKPGCYAVNLADQQNPEAGSAYWRPRNLVDAVAGNATPTFLTAGFLEDNTKPDAVWELFGNLTGPNRGWFGPWDHVRGNDRDRAGRYLTGRDSFIPEVMRFLDEHVRGIAPAVRDPALAVQGSDGRWRSERAWPPADAAVATTALRPGAYVDEGGNHGTCQARDEATGECTDEATGKGLWSISQPLAATAQLAGTPHLTVDAGAPADANLVAAVYDLDAAGDATLVSRGAHLLRGSGQVALELYGNDWRFEPGHRIGVLLSSAHDEWWEHRPSGGEVEIRSVSIDLPFLARPRASNLDGGPAARLESYRAEAPFEVDDATIAAAATPFTLPRRRR